MKEPANSCGKKSFPWNAISGPKNAANKPANSSTDTALLALSSDTDSIAANLNCCMIAMVKPNNPMAVQNSQNDCCKIA